VILGIISKKILSTFVLLALFVPSFVSAQTASTTTVSVDVATLVAQLQEQIKQLQEQLVELQQANPLASTTPEFVPINELTQTLVRGMFSEEVKELQKFLAQNPEIYPAGLITGYFGALTEQAVKKFQEMNGLPPVGIVGPLTRSLINEAFASGGGGDNASALPTMQATPQESLATPAPTGTEASASTAALTQTSEAVTAATPTTTPVVTSVSTAPVVSVSTGSYYAPGGTYTPTMTYVSEPTPPPQENTSSTSTATTTPSEVPPPPPSPSSDTIGPTITSLTITPVSTVIGGSVSFSVTAEDPSGVRSVVYDIKYPGSSYVLRPNCNLNGVISGTCGFGQPIDDGIQNPSLLGDYVIQTVRATDALGNVATYYPDGTVTNGASTTHTLTIPAIAISAP